MPDASSVRYSPGMIVPTTGAVLRRDTTGRGFPDADTFCVGARASPAVRARRGGGRRARAGSARRPRRDLRLLRGAGARAAAARRSSPERSRPRTGAPTPSVADGVLQLTWTCSRTLRSTKLAATFTGQDAWGAYVLGPVALLVREQGIQLAGLRAVISSSIPEAKGSARRQRSRSWARGAGHGLPWVRRAGHAQRAARATR